ncbi:MAG: MogA/MoaB family molybdenum cofactor biosynthesis protein [Synergistaceae bacterium]|nr:MogA/MoaB family molybdenum cofactor biosynthesis protein [Synergistaceae bacterium]
MPSYFLSIGDDLLFRIVEGEPLSSLNIERCGFLPVSARAEVLRPISVGVLTVSDKGSLGQRIDLSGPALERSVVPLGAVVEATAIKPDDMDVIADTLKEWSDSLLLNLVLVTGGTGLSERDVTPEALSSVAHKHVPGIGEAMRSASLRITPNAMLSRLCAVTRNKTLIVGMPGSEKAVLECFAVIAPALRHGIEILCGWDGECGSRPD